MDAIVCFALLLACRISNPPGPKNSRKGDGTHGPGGVYTDNGSTGWNVSGNVFKLLTVWAVACCEPPAARHPPAPRPLLCLAYSC